MLGRTGVLIYLLWGRKKKKKYMHIHAYISHFISAECCWNTISKQTLRYFLLENVERCFSRRVLSAWALGWSKNKFTLGTYTCFLHWIYSGLAVRSPRWAQDMWWHRWDLCLFMGEVLPDSWRSSCRTPDLSAVVWTGSGGSTGSAAGKPAGSVAPIHPMVITQLYWKSRSNI